MSGTTNLCECGCGERCRKRFVRGHSGRAYWRDRPRVPQPTRGKRKVFSPDEKMSALHLVREVGVKEAARRLGMSEATLNDWKAAAKALAYSAFVTTGKREVSDDEKAMLLAQLVHEQELESRFISRRSYRNDPVGGSRVPLYEPLDVLLSRSGTVQRHLLEWLDPTFDEVCESLAA